VPQDGRFGVTLDGASVDFRWLYCRR
jgi:hypothetical protein